jgi:hypothetical protein
MYWRRLVVVVLLLSGCLLLVSGCLDLTPTPSRRTAVSRPLTRAEKKELRRAFLRRAPRPRHRLNVTFSTRRGAAVHLYGVDVSPAVPRRGQTVKLTYYFRALRRLPKVWGIFLHLQSPNVKRYMRNLDHQPVNGLYHSRRWRRGQIFRSVYSFKLPSDFPSRKAVFYTGFWQGNSRMKLSSGAPVDKTGRLRLATIPVYGKGLSKPLYIAYKTTTPPVIDGDLSDNVWKLAPSTGKFLTYNNRISRVRTEARIVWDDKYLYVAFDMDDNDIFSKYSKRDDPLFKQEAVELFIDANRNRKDYIELQVNPQGAIFDSFFTTYRRPRPWGRLSYNSGMLVKVKVRGTVNQRRDRDKGWSVEFRLPLARLKPMNNLPPKDGDEWSINMYRLERSRYTGWEDHAWSPVTTGRGGDYHSLHRFGTLRFSNKTLQSKTPTKTQARPQPRLRVIRKPLKLMRIKPKVLNVKKLRFFKPVFDSRKKIPLVRKKNSLVKTPKLMKKAKFKVRWLPAGSTNPKKRKPASR